MPEAVRDEARTARRETGRLRRDGLLLQMLAKANMEAASKRVKSNRGSAGVDGLSIAETVDQLRAHWPRIRASLLDGSDRPESVRRVRIPKPDGGARELGIPTVTDRLIQPALLQVLQRKIGMQGGVGGERSGKLTAPIPICREVMRYDRIHSGGGV